MSFEKQCQVTSGSEDDNCSRPATAREERFSYDYDYKDSFSSNFAFVLLFHICVVWLQSRWLLKSRQPNLKGHPRLTVPFCTSWDSKN